MTVKIYDQESNQEIDQLHFTNIKSSEVPTFLEDFGYDLNEIYYSIV